MPLMRLHISVNVISSRQLLDREELESNFKMPKAYRDHSVPKPRRGDNIKFLASYIFFNPGSSYSQVVRALLNYNGITLTGNGVGGWYSEYFNRFRGYSHPETGYWKKVDPSNRYSGYVVTLKGMSYVDLRGDCPTVDLDVPIA